MIANLINSKIRIFNDLPKSWGRILNYDKSSETVHYNDGFREVVTPSYDAATQKLGAIFFDEAQDVFTYPVLEKTAEEIAAFNQQQLDSDTAAQKVLQRKSDGVQGFERIFAIIERKFKSGEITAAQAKTAATILYPLVEPLNHGIWIEAQTRLNNATIPTLLKDLYEDIKAVVDSYVTETY